MTSASSRPAKRLRWQAGTLPLRSHTFPSLPAKFARAQRRGTRKGDRCQPRVPEDGEQTILALLPLVRRMASQLKKRLPAHVEMDDLVSLGAIGLLDAVRRFDPRRHVKIESYARYRIRGAILDGLRDWDNASRDLRRKNKKAERAQRELECKLGRPAGDEEIAQALGVSLEKWFRTVNELQPVGMSWLHPRGDGILPCTWDENCLPDTRENPFDLCYRRERREILNRALAGLPRREKEIICFYYARQITMKQIGNLLGIDESRVSQLHSAALNRLRAAVQMIQKRPRPLAAAPPAASGRAALSSFGRATAV
jgi:RNA polymerase sigma factor FliA